MTPEQRHALLKIDLQLTTQANDDYLNFLLSDAEERINREGVQDDGSFTYDGLIIHYAAYLFSKRRAASSGGTDGDTAMPRFLRYDLNKLLFSQKAGEDA